MQKITQKTIKDKASELIRRMDTLCTLLRLYATESPDKITEEEVSAWRNTIDHVVARAMVLAKELDAELRLSFLNNNKRKIASKAQELKQLFDKIATHTDFADPKLDEFIQLVQGMTAYLYGEMTHEDYERLYDAEWEKYKWENLSLIETIYQQDYKDLYGCYTDRERKTQLFERSRDELIRNASYGAYYHDCGRNKAVLSKKMFEDEPDDYQGIYNFFNKKLTHEYAKSLLEDNENKLESINNLIFHESLDAELVCEKLNEYIANGILTAQKHWYVVYVVFKEKKWLRKDSQQAFRDQVNAVFEKRLKCTEHDFHEVDSYYKKTDFRKWSLSDPQAPQGCDTYITLAKTLDNEFVDNKYVLPGKIILRRQIKE